MASGDLASSGPNLAARPITAAWGISFRGFEILDADSMRVWYDRFNPDETFVANRADVFPLYPWELNHLMTESVLANETSLHDLDAALFARQPLDLAKGATFGFLDPRLASNRMNETIPSFLSPWVTASEATSRWAALNEWRNPAAGGCIDGPFVWSCNYLVSQGPYYLDQYFTAPEGAQYQAKRIGYPIEQDAWAFLGTIRIPSVTLGTPPEVIQTFPATFQFSTSLNGAPYDLISTAAWLLLEPGTKNILFSGDASRSGPGAWDIVLTAEQTTALVEGTYELLTFVVGAEAALPVVTTQSFTSLSLASAIIADLTVVLDAALVDFQVEIDRAVDAADAANSAAVAATSLANTVLIVAIVAVVVAVAAVVLAVVWGRRGSRP